LPDFAYGVVKKFLERGGLNQGFARVHYPECRQELTGNSYTGTAGFRVINAINYQKRA
jgi:hypothetical protein